MGVDVSPAVQLTKPDLSLNSPINPAEIKPSEAPSLLEMMRRRDFRASLPGDLTATAVPSLPALLGEFVCPTDGKLELPATFRQTAGSGATTSVDLMVNGATALTGTMDTDNTDGHEFRVSGVFDTDLELVSRGDTVQFLLTAIEGGAPEGIYASVTFVALGA